MSAGWRPSREIELVAGTPAGGGQDRPARALIRVLESGGLIDVPLKLVNIPGRGGGNAWDYLAQHPNDPHVLAINSPTILTNRVLGVSAIDDRDLTPLANLYTEYIAFLVRADSKLRSGADLLAALGTGAGALTIAMATAIGNTNHMALAQLARHAGEDPRALALHVFDSARYAAADVMDGKAEVAAITAVSAVPELESGALRALAVSAPQRLPALYAATPTWRELGVDCVIGTWRGVIGAHGLTDAQVKFWNDALQAATSGAEWNAELARQYWVNTWAAAAQMPALMQSERATLTALLRDLGLTGG
ncbi:MAG: tripartite tricarboxylate transporter substrate binding protein [Burkholderiales bacterium]